MEPALTPIVRRVPAGEVEISIREWAGAERPFVLVHGLASNAQTWDGVAHGLASAGHHVVAFDQRGHGLSDKPDSSYGFEEVTSDLRAVVSSLGVQQPIVAGQSWGGNVVMHFAAHHPGVAAGSCWLTVAFPTSPAVQERRGRTYRSDCGRLTCWARLEPE